MALTVDVQKLAMLLGSFPEPVTGELRRQGNIIFIDSDPPPASALEAIFASNCHTPVELFSFSFIEPPVFIRLEELVRAVRKNFRGYLLGSFPFLPTTDLIDRAYAAGLDLIDLPQPPATESLAQEVWQDTLDYAGTVFPRWGVLASLPIGAWPLQQPREAIPRLLARGVLPLLLLTPSAAVHPQEELACLFDGLQQEWKQAGASLKPLQPLLQLTTPFSSLPPRRGLAGILDKVQDAHQRTASDLRRLLRVREVEQSFESAGL